MENKARLLFFCRDASPTLAELDDIKKQVSRGFRVDIRNAIYAKLDGDLEPADAVAGEATPKAYQDAYPWADDYDPDTTPDIGDEWVDDDGVAFIRAVRGDGVAFNMPLTIAAPAGLGSGAPTHGPFAGVDHVKRIRDREAADRQAAGGEGEGEGSGTGQNGGQGGSEGQSSGEGAGEQPPAAPKRPVVRRKPAKGWQRNT